MPLQKNWGCWFKNRRIIFFWTHLSSNFQFLHKYLSVLSTYKLFCHIHRLHRWALSLYTTPHYITHILPQKFNAIAFLCSKVGKWKVESGKLKVESWKLKVESGKLKMESGKWRVENGKLRVARETVGIAYHFAGEMSSYKFLSTTKINRVPCVVCG